MNENDSGSIMANRRRVTTTMRSLFIALLATFVSGAVIGGAVGAALMRSRLLETMRQPGGVPDRIVRMLQARLSLTDDQTTEIAAIIRERHAAMERIRAEEYPRYLAEFRAIEEEVASLLDPERRAQWRAIWRSAHDRFMPAPPKQAPGRS